MRWPFAGAQTIGPRNRPRNGLATERRLEETVRGQRIVPAGFVVRSSAARRPACIQCRAGGLRHIGVLFTQHRSFGVVAANSGLLTESRTRKRDRWWSTQAANAVSSIRRRRSWVAVRGTPSRSVPGEGARSCRYPPSGTAMAPIVAREAASFPRLPPARAHARIPYTIRAPRMVFSGYGVALTRNKRQRERSREVGTMDSKTRTTVWILAVLFVLGTIILGVAT